MYFITQLFCLLVHIARVQNEVKHKLELQVFSMHVQVYLYSRVFNIVISKVCSLVAGINDFIIGFNKRDFCKCLAVMSLVFLGPNGEKIRDAFVWFERRPVWGSGLDDPTLVDSVTLVELKIPLTAQPWGQGCKPILEVWRE